MLISSTNPNRNPEIEQIAMIIEDDLIMPILSAKIPPMKGPNAAIAKAIAAIVFPEILLENSPELAAKIEFKNIGLQTRRE